MPNQWTSSQARKNRLKAIEEDKKTYIGSTACKHCGSYEKYVSSYGCYPCNYKKGVERLLSGSCEGYMTKEKWAKNRERRKEKIKENNRKYSKSERGKAISAENQRRRYARVKQGIPIEITNEELRMIQEIYQEAQRLTSSTGVCYHVDHIIPLFEGGMHHPDNLQVITYDEHLKKTAEENSRRQSK
jgi:5-methylcytosine-specific restriction endonuclease McrA